MNSQIHRSISPADLSPPQRTRHRHHHHHHHHRHSTTPRRTQQPTSVEADHDQQTTEQNPTDL